MKRNKTEVFWHGVSSWKWGQPKMLNNVKVEEAAQREYECATVSDVVEVYYDGNGYAGIPVKESLAEGTGEPYLAASQVAETTPQYAYSVMNAYQMPMLMNGYGYCPVFTPPFIPVNYSNALQATLPSVLADISASITGKRNSFVEGNDLEMAQSCREVEVVDSPTIEVSEKIVEQTIAEKKEEDDADACEDTVRLFLQMIKGGNLKVVSGEAFIYGKYHGFEDDNFVYVDVEPTFEYLRNIVKIINPKRELVDLVKFEKYLYQRGYVEPENEATRRYRKRVTVVTKEGKSERKRLLWLKKTAFDLLSAEVDDET